MKKNIATLVNTNTVTLNIALKQNKIHGFEEYTLNS